MKAKTTGSHLIMIEIAINQKIKRVIKKEMTDSKKSTLTTMNQTHKQQ
jgi:hypothetical protein